MFEAFARGDLPAILAHTSPELEINDPDRTGSTWHGHQGYVEFMSEWLETWEDYEAEPQSFTEIGDHVLVDLIQTGVGKSSGIELNEPVFQLSTFKDGKAVRCQVFTQRKDALAAAEPN